MAEPKHPHRDRRDRADADEAERVRGFRPRALARRGPRAPAPPGNILGEALAGACPWPAGEVRLYAKLGTSFLATDELATPDGTTAEIPEFERWEVALYVEYGLSPGWTAIAHLPLRSESSIERFGSAYGPGDVTLGLQRQLWSGGPWALAARASLQAPTGDPNLGEGLLPTGTGAWEGGLQLSLGRSLARGRGWAYLEAGPRIRGEGLRDALAYRSQVGVHLGQRLRLALTVHGIDPRSGASDELGPAAGLGDGVQYLAVGPELHVDLRSRWSLELGAEDTTDTRNLATGLTLRAGLARRR